MDSESSFDSDLDINMDDLIEENNKIIKSNSSVNPIMLNSLISIGSSLFYYYNTIKDMVSGVFNWFPANPYVISTQLNGTSERILIHEVNLIDENKKINVTNKFIYLLQKNDLTLYEINQFCRGCGYPNCSVEIIYSLAIGVVKLIYTGHKYKIIFNDKESTENVFLFNIFILPNNLNDFVFEINKNNLVDLKVDQIKMLN